MVEVDFDLSYNYLSEIKYVVNCFLKNICYNYFIIEEDIILIILTKPLLISVIRRMLEVKTYRQSFFGSHDKNDLVTSIYSVDVEILKTLLKYDDEEFTAFLLANT